GAHEHLDLVRLALDLFLGGHGSLSHYCARCPTSSRMPGLIVEQMLAFWTKTPLAAGGLSVFTCSKKASRFSLRRFTSNDFLPKIAWRLPPSSTRYFALPPLNSLTAVTTSAVTEPSLGFGMSFFGPRTLPSLPTTRIMPGWAMTTSKSNQPSSIFFARSAPPTSSAPAALACSARAPSANATTRFSCPIPCGNEKVPRICWSDFLASMPSFRWTSTDSSNLTFLNFLRRLSPSSIE